MAVRVLGGLWYLIVCSAVFGIATLGGWIGRSKFLSLRGVLDPPRPQATFKSDVQTFLILGCDEEYSHDSYKQRYQTSRRIEHTPDTEALVRNSARTDMMMVARMDFVNKTITGVSIPRDTWCQLPGDEEHKINAYYSIAPKGSEIELTKKAVEFLIGVPIDKVIVMNFDKMQKFVDIIGGVNVTVPRQMDYDDYAGMLHVHLKPGFQKLDGYKAMGYVRFRHSNKGKAETDFQRQQREKDMLLGMRQAVISRWGSLPEIVDGGRAVLGDSLSDEQVLSLAGFARSVGSQNIQIGVIPTEPEGNGLRLLTRKLPEVLGQYKLGPKPAIESAKLDGRSSRSRSRELAADAGRS